MLRCLALLIVCVVAVLAQAGPSMAHVGQPLTSTSEHGLSSAELAASPVDDEDCPSGSGCCSAVCAPCYLPLPAPQSGSAIAPPKSSQPLGLRQDCLRSIILGRDPPIPRNRVL